MAVVRTSSIRLMGPRRASTPSSHGRSCQENCTDQSRQHVVGEHANQGGTTPVLPVGRRILEVDHERLDRGAKDQLDAEDDQQAGRYTSWAASDGHSVLLHIGMSSHLGRCQRTVSRQSGMNAPAAVGHVPHTWFVDAANAATVLTRGDAWDRARSASWESTTVPRFWTSCSASESRPSRTSKRCSPNHDKYDSRVA